MIVRQALFEGSVHPGCEAEFRAYVEQALLPLWRRFPGVREVRVLHETERDSGIPEVAMVLSMAFDGPEALRAALDCETCRTVTSLLTISGAKAISPPV